MLCPKCEYGNPEDAYECGNCGVIFGRIISQGESGRGKVEGVREAVISDVPVEGGHGVKFSALISELYLGGCEPVNSFTFAGRVLVLVLFMVWGLRFISASLYSPFLARSFLHRVDLVFHEAGHILFIPLGSFLTILGGSLMQVLVPCIFSVAFILYYRNPFAASVTFWWVGQSLIDIAPYINDARDRQLMLLGGITGRDNSTVHDWYNILSRLDLLRYDHAIARAARLTGILIILAALVWGGLVLVRQYRRLER